MEEMDAYLLDKRASDFESPPCPKDRNPIIRAFLAAGLDAPLLNPPGTTVGYSNFGFEMLGDIVRQVSGQPLDSFAAQHIFEPLGMQDTHYGLAANQANRLVRRPLDAPGARVTDTWFFDGIEGTIVRENPWAYGSVVSTAADMGIFCQMFLNKGSYGAERILSPATVAEMTRNQTEGLIDLDRKGTLPDAARGLGWDLPVRKNSLLYGSLYSTQTFKHSGAGGVMVWIDPKYDLVGVFLSVELSIRRDGQRNWRGDHFANAVTACIVDA
jgi:CubicO group peptidase (beta-lactamase class C family)